MKTTQLISLHGTIILVLMIWPCVHRILVDTQDVNPWKLSGFGMYCTPHGVQTRLMVQAGEDDVRAVAEEMIPRDVQQALHDFTVRREIFGKLHSPIRAEAVLRRSLPRMQRFFIGVWVTRLDSESGELVMERELYPIRAARPRAGP